MNTTITEKEEIRRGALLAKILNLRKSKKTGFYSTEWGTKTDMGLFRIIARIVEDGE